MFHRNDPATSDQMDVFLYPTGHLSQFRNVCVELVPSQVENLNRTSRRLVRRQSNCLVSWEYFRITCPSVA